MLLYAPPSGHIEMSKRTDLQNLKSGNFIWCDTLTANEEGDELTEKVNFIM